MDFVFGEMMKIESSVLCSAEVYFDCWDAVLSILLMDVWL